MAAQSRRKRGNAPSCQCAALRAKCLLLQQQLSTETAKTRDLEEEKKQLLAEVRKLRSSHELNPPQPFNILFKAPVTVKKRDPTKAPYQRLLQQAPRTEEDWAARRKAVGLDNPRALIQTLFHLLSGTKPRASSASIGNPTDIGHLLQAYQEFVLKLAQESQHANQISNYVSLVFSCLCRVACLSKKLSLESADDYMNSVVRSGKENLSSTSLSHLRTSVLWPLHQARKLRENGLGNRADEFFLLCKSNANMGYLLANRY
jgi:hypothetical protein